MYEERLHYLKKEVERKAACMMKSNHIHPGVIHELRAEAVRRNRRLEEMSIGFFAFEDAMERN